MCETVDTNSSLPFRGWLCNHKQTLSRAWALSDFQVENKFLTVAITTSNPCRITA